METTLSDKNEPNQLVATDYLVHHTAVAVWRACCLHRTKRTVDVDTERNTLHTTSMVLVADCCGFRGRTPSTILFGIVFDF